MQNRPNRGWDARVAEQALGNVLIHGKQTARIARARIADAVGVERCLELPVLAHRAVQGEEHAVCRGTEREDVRADQRVTVSAACPECFKVGDLLRDSAHGVGVCSEKRERVGGERGSDALVNV